VGARVAASRVSRLKSGYAVQALIADDLEENRRVLAELLQSIGCQVAVAEGGAEAVEACGVSRPDIVFMDIRMPGMDGREAAQRIWRTHGPMPIVAVSASALIHERQRYLQDGFAGFVAKPLQFDRICQCLVDLLQVEFDDADHPAPEPPWSRVALPASLLAALREAAGQGEVTRLRATLHEVEPLGEAQRQLAEHLLALSRDLDLNAIRSILDALDDE
jgi:CheY-like chemotaxis protein